MANIEGDRRPQLLAASITTTAISLIALVLRFVSRYKAKKSTFWWDDWLALASVPFALTLLGLNAWWVHLGLGLHVQEAIHHGTPQQWKLVLYIENLIYNTGLSLIKLSVVLFYLRIFKKINLYKYVIWFTAFLVVAWCLGNDFLAAFECTPARSYWDTSIEPHYCIDNEKGFLGTTVSNLVVDVIILIVPMPMLWRLQLSMQRKLAIIGIFLCGYAVVVVSTIRLVSITRLGNDLNDFTWQFVLAQLMVTIEVPFALFSSCLPANFYLFKMLLERARFGTNQSSGNITNNGNIAMGQLGNPHDPVDTHKGSFTRLESCQDSDISNVSDQVERLYPIPELSSPPLEHDRQLGADSDVEALQSGVQLHGH